MKFRDNPAIRVSNKTFTIGEKFKIPHCKVLVQIIKQDNKLRVDDINQKKNTNDILCRVIETTNERLKLDFQIWCWVDYLEKV